MSELSKPFKYKFTLGIGLCNCTQEEIVDLTDWGHTAEELTQMNSVEFENALYIAWTEWSNNYIDGGQEPVED